MRIGAVLMILAVGGGSLRRGARPHSRGLFGPHVHFEPRVRVSRMLIRIHVHRGLKAMKAPVKDDMNGWALANSSPST